MSVVLCCVVSDDVSSETNVTSSALTGLRSREIRSQFTTQMSRAPKWLNEGNAYSMVTEP